MQPEVKKPTCHRLSSPSLSPRRLLSWSISADSVSVAPAGIDLGGGGKAPVHAEANGSRPRALPRLALLHRLHAPANAGRTSRPDLKSLTLKIPQGEASSACSSAVEAIVGNLWFPPYTHFPLLPTPPPPFSLSPSPPAINSWSLAQQSASGIRNNWACGVCALATSLRAPTWLCWLGTP